jgi:hypothetical protein
MVKRRKVLIGAGSLLAGGAAATGTGAFVTQDMERGARAKVQNDLNGQITLTALDDDYARQNNGPNVRALSVKADLQNTDALTDYGPIFEIGNNGGVAGDQEDYKVYITVQSDRFTDNKGEDGNRIVRFDWSGGQLNTTDNTEPSNAPTLNPGGSIDVSMTLDTRGLKNVKASGTDSYKLFKQITIVAEEV